MVAWGMGNLVLAIVGGKRRIADAMAYVARAAGVFLGAFGTPS